MKIEQIEIGFANAALYTTFHDTVTDKVFHGIDTFSTQAQDAISTIVSNFITNCGNTDIDLSQYNEKMIGITLFFTMCGSGVAGFNSASQFTYDKKELMQVVSAMKIKSLSRDAVFKDNDKFSINLTS